MPALTIKELLSRKKNDRRFMENVRAMKHLPAFEGKFAPFPAWVHRSIQSILKARGIYQLYSHQAEAIDLVGKGRDVVLITPTASGKTMCYNIPVLNKIIEEPE